MCTNSHASSASSLVAMEIDMSRSVRVILAIILWSTLLFASAVPRVNAQELDWVKKAGSTALDQGFGIDVDAEGNVYVTGSFNEEITFEQGNPSASSHLSAGSFDSYVARYSEAGALLWTISFGGTGQDRIYELALDGNGDVILVGSFEDRVVLGQGESNETTLVSLGSSDIFIAKYTADGLLLWARQAGGGSDDVAYALCLDANGNSFIGGAYRIQATFGPGEGNEVELTCLGVEDMFLAKYNPDGLLLWARGAGGSVSDFANGIGVDEDGNSLVTGTFSNRATFAHGEPQELTLDSGSALSNLFLAKYDVDGVLLWAKRAGGNSGGNLSVTDPRGIDVDAFGNSYLTGSFGETTTFGEGEANETTLTSLGSIDVFMAKYNADGLLLWVKHPEGVGHDVGRSLVLDDSANFYLVGDFEESIVLGSGEVNQTTIAGFGSFLSKFNTEGTLLWVRNVGSSSQGVVVFNHVLDTSENILLTGAFWGDTTFGAGENNETTYSSAGSSDIFVAKYGAEIQTSIDPVATLSTKYTLSQNYPNPFSNTTTISFEVPLNEQVALWIYNIEGRLVRKMSLDDILSGQQRISWDGRDDQGRQVRSGPYILKLVAGKQRISKTMILLR